LQNYSVLLSRKQFAGNFPSDSQLLLTDIYAKRNRNLEPIKPDPAFEGFFRGTNKATDFEPGKLLQRPLPFWNVLENERIASAKLSLGPRNHWEEQIQWTKQGRMWPYPIDNEYLIGEEAQVCCGDLLIIFQLTFFSIRRASSIMYFWSRYWPNTNCLLPRPYPTLWSSF
jgi:hypothetical protein